MWAADGAAHVAGAAKRRRERRHRAYLKYVRMSVAMALSEYKHHTSRGQNMDRAGGGVRDAVHGQVPEALLPQEPGTQHFSLDDDDSVPELGGSRPDRIDTLSGPQERDLRRTVEQIVDAVPLVPLLDDPVPQMAEQLQDVMRFFDTLLPVPEQVIAAPKILLDDVPMRTAVRDTQLVEQLVEVPTIISWSSLLQRSMEQNVDIPVPGGGGGISGAQGFLPRQSSTALHGSLERISERIVAQNVDFPVGGGLQDFLPGQTSSASSSSPAGVHDSTDGPVEGVFRTFPRKKKSAKIGSHSGSELLPESSPSTPAAHVDALSGVELLAKIQQLSDQVVDMGRVAEHARKGFSSDIDQLYRLITDARHRLQQLEAWVEEGSGDDDGPG